MNLLHHIQHYLIEGVEEKYTYLKKKFPKKSESDLRELATKIDNKLIKADIQKIKEDEIDSLIEQAKTTKSKTEAKTKGIEGLVEEKDYFSVATNKDFIKAYVVLNHKASKTIASAKVCNVEAKWCIAENVADYWQDYFIGGQAMIMFVINSETSDKAYAKLAYIFHKPEVQAWAYNSEDEELTYTEADKYLKTHGINTKSAWKKFKSPQIQKFIDIEDVIKGFDSQDDITEEFKKTVASKINAPLKSFSNVAFLINLAFEYHPHKDSKIDIELLKKVLKYGDSMPLSDIKNRILTLIKHNEDYFPQDNIEEAKKIIA